MAPSPITRGMLNSPSPPSLDEITKTITKIVEAAKAEIMSYIETKIDRMDTKIDSIDNRVRSIENAFLSVKKEMDSLDKQVKSLGMDVDRMKSRAHETIDETIDEFQQIQARRCSLIVFGLTERSSGTLLERNEHDLLKLQEVLEEMKMPHIQVKNAQRIGKPRKDGKRLLKLQLTCPSDRQEILQHARKLKHTEHSEIYINPDLTPRQQQNSRILRKELKERRAAGEQVSIFRGRIVSSEEMKNFH